MKNRISVVDTYYEQMENRCLCKLSEQMLGIKYKISKDVGKGTISRIIIDEGLEIAHWDSSATMEWSYDNEGDNSTIIKSILLKKEI